MIIRFDGDTHKERLAKVAATSLPAPELSNDKTELIFSCPECGENCDTQYRGITLLGCYSPPGHDHDSICRTFRANCPNGHKYEIRVRNTCPTPGCDWKSREFCTVCGNNVRKINDTKISS